MNYLSRPKTKDRKARKLAKKNWLKNKQMKKDK